MAGFYRGFPNSFKSKMRNAGLSVCTSQKNGRGPPHEPDHGYVTTESMQSVGLSCQKNRYNGDLIRSA